MQVTGLNYPRPVTCGVVSVKGNSMRNLIRISSLLGIILLNLFVTRLVLAFPQLPSSFYVKVEQLSI
jgi:hypothetical protein